jgi:hypothetical protein
MCTCAHRATPRGNQKIDFNRINIFYITQSHTMDTPRTLTRMFSRPSPSDYTMTEEEERFDHATAEERQTTQWSWTPPVLERTATLTRTATVCEPRPSLTRIDTTPAPASFERFATPMPPSLTRYDTTVACEPRSSLTRYDTTSAPPSSPAVPNLYRHYPSELSMLPPPILKRQTAMGSMEYPPSPALVREDAFEPIYNLLETKDAMIRDLRAQMTEMRAQMTEMRAQMTEMRAQMDVLLQKIETKE